MNPNSRTPEDAATPRILGMARNCLHAEPDIAADMLADVQRTLARIVAGLLQLRSIVDDYDGGMLPPAEAMTAVRAAVRAMPWEDA